MVKKRRIHDHNEKLYSKEEDNPAHIDFRKRKIRPMMAVKLDKDDYNGAYFLCQTAFEDFSDQLSMGRCINKPSLLTSAVTFKPSKDTKSGGENKCLSVLLKVSVMLQYLLLQTIVKTMPGKLTVIVKKNT